MKNKFSFLGVSFGFAVSIFFASGAQAESFVKKAGSEFQLESIARLYSVNKNELSFNRLAAKPEAPPQLQGNFSLKDNGISLNSARHELIIFTGSSESQKFVSKLRGQRYACQNFDSRHVKCSRFLADLNAIGSNFKNVYDRYGSEKLEIFQAISSPELLNDAEYLTEWKLTQNAKWMGQKFTQLYYSVIKDPALSENVIKMKFTNGADQRGYFYLVGHVGGVDIAFQHLEVLKLQPAKNFVVSEQMNCLLEVFLTKE